MIYVYALAHWMRAYAFCSLAAIRGGTAAPLTITVADNASPHSATIREDMAALARADTIARGVFFDTNIMGRALTEAYRLFPPGPDAEFVVFTDLDVGPEPRQVHDWVDEHRRLRREEPNLLVTGFSLDPVNYVPPNEGWGEDRERRLFGCYLVAVDPAAFRERWDFGSAFTDMLLIQRMDGRSRRSPQLLYHWGWNAYRDDPTYWQHKLAQNAAGAWQHPHEAAGGDVVTQNVMHTCGWADDRIDLQRQLGQLRLQCRGCRDTGEASAWQRCKTYRF